MARTLQVIHHSTALVRLKTARNTHTSNPVKILEVFRSNLAKLYSQKTLTPLRPTLPSPI